MGDKFDPAPENKHATDAKQAAQGFEKKDQELDKAMKDSFPASDPVSSTQASEAQPD